MPSLIPNEEDSLGRPCYRMTQEEADWMIDLSRELARIHANGTIRIYHEMPLIGFLQGRLQANLILFPHDMRGAYSDPRTMIDNPWPEDLRLPPT